MAETHIIAGLVEKPAELTGRLRAIAKEAENIKSAASSRVKRIGSAIRISARARISIARERFDISQTMKKNLRHMSCSILINFRLKDTIQEVVQAA